MLYDKDDGSLFTDLLEFDILELRKSPAESDGTARWWWMKFFGSGNDADLQAAAREREAIGKAMLTIAKLSADEAAWINAIREEKQRRDHIAIMEGAREEGREQERMENARRMKADGVDAVLIAKYTGLSQEDIARL
jgi:predicted transposase/invertase (TIGR01784 family)